MEKVRGIGGFFFRAENPKKLAQWYLTHLGIDLVPTTYEVAPWTTTEGPTVFSPFSKDTEYFGSAKNFWMINFRVDNLEAMVKQLEAAGIEVTVDSEEYPNGFFARIYDPEGNPIELWQPIDSTEKNPISTDQLPSEQLPSDQSSS